MSSLISIIIPIHDNHNYLNPCLKSIPNEPWLELILVVNSYEDIIIPRVPDRVKKINLKSNPILGAGGARNKGLQFATGDWIMFLDSDDLIDGYQLRILAEEIKSNVDVYVMNISSNSKKRIEVYQDHLLSCHQGNADILSLLLSWTPPWGKLIDRHFLQRHGLEFECVRFSNDVLFSTRLALSEPRVELIMRPIYFVRSHSKSLTKSLGVESFRIRLDEELKRYNLVVKSGYTVRAPRLLTWLVRSVVFGADEAIRTYKEIGIHRLDLYRTSLYYFRRLLAQILVNMREK